MNRSKLYASFAAVVATTLWAGAALAQDPKFAHGSEEDLTALEKAKEIVWTAGAQVGVVATTGNTRNRTLNGGIKASRMANKNKLQLELGAAYIRSDVLVATDAGPNPDGVIGPGEFERVTQTSAKSWDAKGRYDRFLTKKNALYLTGLASANEPAGKKFVGGGQFGYSRTAFKDDKTEVLVEVGYDLSYEKPVTGKGFLNHSMRSFVGYTGKLAKKTGLEASVEALFNVNELDTPVGKASRFEDARIKGKTAVSTELVEDLKLQAGFTATYDNVPSPLPAFGLPFANGFVPEADELDTKTELTLIYSFL